MSSIFLIIFHLTSEAQNAWKTLNLANSQMKWGNIDEAIALYQRVLFFDTIKSNSFEACKNLALCYISKSDYLKAREFLRMAYNFSPSDSVKYELAFQTASLYLLEKEHNYALIELFGMRSTDDDYFIKRKGFYLGIAYYQKEEYDKSFDSFIMCLDTNNIQAIDELIQIFELVNKYNKRYNPKTSRTLSMIIPGTGQLICGDFKGAANSFLLTGGLIFLFVNTSIHYSFIDAGISVMPWFQRYYQGGYQNAEKIAIAKKRKKITGQYQRIITLIEKSTV